MCLESVHSVLAVFTAVLSECTAAWKQVLGRQSAAQSASRGVGARHIGDGDARSARVDGVIALGRDVVRLLAAVCHTKGTNI